MPKFESFSNQIRNQNEKAVKPDENPKNGEVIYDTSIFSVDECAVDFKNKYLKNLYERDENGSFIKRDFKYLEKNLNDGLADIKSELMYANGEESSNNSLKLDEQRSVSLSCCLMNLYDQTYKKMFEIAEKPLNLYDYSDKKTKEITSQKYNSNKQKRQEVLDYFFKEISLDEKQFNAFFNFLNENAYDKKDLPIWMTVDYKKVSPYHILLDYALEIFSKRIANDNGILVEINEKDKIMNNLNINEKKVIQAFVNAVSQIKVAPEENNIVYDLSFICSLERDYAKEIIMNKLLERDYREASFLVIQLADLVGEISEKAYDELAVGRNGLGTLAFILASAKAQENKLDLKKFINLNLDIKQPGQGQNMNSSDKEEVISMARINWEKQNPKLAKAVIKGLKKSLQDTTNQKYYILKYHGRIISFIRFEQTDHDTTYCGSFNIESELRGLGLGEEMMIEVIKTEAKKNILEATASPRTVVGTCYVEKVGFVLDGYISDYHGTSEPLFSMRLDNKKNKQYQYRNEGKETTIGEDEIKKQVWQHENLDHVVGSDTIVLKFDMKADFEKMKKTMEKLLVAKDDNSKEIAGQNLENKYVVIRYFQDDKNDKENHVRYFVFEKK